jgi:hypothetical protein
VEDGEQSGAGERKITETCPAGGGGRQWQASLTPRYDLGRSWCCCYVRRFGASELRISP